MPKRLVICADGTWNEPEQTDRRMPADSNVVKLARAVLPQDPNGIPQIILYHKGVGERAGLWDHLTGGAFGVGISANIEDIYLFLVNNYQPGDELFLFGFSRGAYTVRSLAGLIRKCGILRRENLRRYEDAYNLYRERTDESHPTAERAVAFRKECAWPEFVKPDFRIRFIGVWDTVGALGIPVTPRLRFWTKKWYEFHDVSLSSHVDYAYQALAIDERRKPFQPAIWEQQQSAPPNQVLEQAWFPGVHCNVGGGYVDTGLSDGALIWMWDRATHAGLSLDDRFKPVANPRGELRDSMTLGYRLLGDGTRKLGSKNPQAKEGVNQSAPDRMRLCGDYEPQNLNEFLGTTPPPRIFSP